jgi:putative transposase
MLSVTKKRPDFTGYVVHALNRRVDRQTLFTSEKDYSEFRSLLGFAIDKFDLRILEWVLMPNHFHLLAWPEHKTQLSKFMGWLCSTHAKNWREATDTVGEGALYQDRYKAFIVSPGPHLHKLRNYLSMNPVKAKLVQEPWQWRWGSSRRAKYKSYDSDITLHEGPEPQHPNLSDLLFRKMKMSRKDRQKLKMSLARGAPFGDDNWQDLMIQEHGLEHTVRQPGRPKSTPQVFSTTGQQALL